MLTFSKRMIHRPGLVVALAFVFGLLFTGQISSQEEKTTKPPQAGKVAPAKTGSAKKKRYLLQPPPQNFVAHQPPTQPRFVRQGVDTSGDGRENTFDPSQNAQAHHAAPPPEGRRERRHRERAEQRRAAASGAPPPQQQHQQHQQHPAGPGPAQDDAAMLREAFEAERHARRVLEEQLLVVKKIHSFHVQ